MSARPNLLLLDPVYRSDAWTAPLATGALNLIVHGRDSYAPEAIDYVVSYRPPPGLLKTLPNLKCVLSIGAGVDGFFADGEYPGHVPLLRLVEEGLAEEMAQFVIMHVLIHHRRQRLFDEAQQKREWRRMNLPRRTDDTHIGILGLGEIGSFTATRLRELGFPVAGWSRTRKALPGVKSFAGEEELAAFLGQADILICLLPLTQKTHGILNAKTFAAMPPGGFVINVARGGHLIEADLIAALDSGQLSGAVLDVFEQEPPAEDSLLWSHPKITVTPHIAALPESGTVARFVLDAIAKFERGEMPDNIVDVEREY